MAKFRKFQRPVDFEPKLTHVKRILDEIEERRHLIEIRNDDPEILHGQLDFCMVCAHSALTFWPNLFQAFVI